MPTLRTLDDLAALVEGREDLYVRWSKGPDEDAAEASKDALTGVELPGLSANPLAVEPWWEDRPVRLWVARRLYDYRHLRELRGPDVRAWVLAGREQGRGPDNEPLVTCDEAVAWIADEALAECEQLVGDWGPLSR
ncbi:hypothetical protein Lesp02_21670 [Lentzea sp. NBRC 105346]|nr:hypothetical protein Lesp02_21670 [Lentzea sp. NBRC 105346]